MNADEGTIASYYADSELFFSPFPEEAMSNCPTHGQPFQLIPAGVSKTSGNPYPAFWACPTRGCKQKPPTDGQDAPQAPRPTPTPQGAARAPQGPSGASEHTLLLLGCLDFSSRVYQGTGDDLNARALAFAIYQQAKGEL